MKGYGFKLYVERENGSDNWSLVYSLKIAVDVIPKNQGTHTSTFNGGRYRAWVDTLDKNGKFVNTSNIVHFAIVNPNQRKGA